MLGRLKKSAAASPPPIPNVLAVRETLFGDAPLEAWPSNASAAEHEPWATFVRGRDAFAAGQTESAIAAWRSIVATPGLESRHYAQAWQFLRQAGVAPSSAESKQMLGVVIEVPMEEGLDLLAAYPERNARYFNHSGRGV